VSSITFGNSEFVASLYDGTFRTSGDGMVWRNPWPEPAPALDDLEYLKGEFFAVGYQGISRSADGRDWTNNVAITNLPRFWSVTYGKGLYVAGSEYRTIWISSDGIHWTNPAPGLTSSYVANVAVAYGNGVFVGAADS